MVYLETCSVDEIEDFVQAALALQPERLAEQLKTIQEDALQRYSREAFYQEMKEHILPAIRAHQR